MRPGGGRVEIREPIGLGHKVALADIAQGEPVRKYGQIIGFAAKAIPAGSLVHVNNLKADLFERDYAFATEVPVTAAAEERKTFRGYLRPDGRVGTRNYIAVISTVNCSASTSRYVADRFRDNLWRKDFPNVDGVFAVTHKGGCGLPFEGPDHQILERVLAGFANHPNVAAYVVVGLGCEVAFAQHLVDAQDLVTLGTAKANGHTKPGVKPRMLNIQEEGGITRTVEAAARAVYELLPEANSWERTEQPASRISLAMECGGSDGNSGVTANPALGRRGRFAGGTGGHGLSGRNHRDLWSRAPANPAGGIARRRAKARRSDQVVGMVHRYLRCKNRQQPVTGQQGGRPDDDLREVAGGTRQGGLERFVDVVPYAARVDGPGLIFMDTPGYDPPCTTGLIAGGANVLVFTTGRGSVLGLKPTPCIKLATNTPMYERMIADMDMDAGAILEGEPVAEVGRRLFDLILDVASGAPTKSEQQGVGEEEFAPWTIGPTL